MKTIALILNGTVVNIVVWDGKSKWNPGSQYTTVDLTKFPGVVVGSTYDGTTFTAPAPLNGTNFVTTLQFFTRFTQAEMSTILAAAASNPALAYWVAMSQAASAINLNDPKVSAALQLLVTAGVLTQARMNAILN